MGVYEYEDNVTLEGLEGEYIEYVKETKQLRTWKDRKEHLQTLKDFFKNKRLSQITPKDIDDYKIFRKQKVKPATVNRELATLRHIFNLAKRWKKFYGENPVSEAGLMPEDNQRDRVLSLEEEKRLLANCAPHLKPIIITALNTGMRRGEILSLEWRDIDFDNNLIIIKASKNKSKKIKKVPMSSFLKRMLLELRMRNSKLINEDKIEHVFLGDDDKPVKDIKTAFNNACRRARIEEIRFHDLKHTAATRLVECGVDIVTIADILGNSSIQMLKKRYLHPDSSLRNAVEKLANFEQSCSQNRSHAHY